MRSVNSLFFGVFFAIIASLHCIHVSLIDQGDGWLKFQFLLNAFFQCFLEVALLAFISKLLSKTIRLVFIGCTMVIFLLHCIEFFLIRLMDISIQYGIGMVFDESIENFIEMLYATHIPIFTWLMIVALSGGAILGGIVLYLKSEKWSLRHPLHFKKGYLMVCGALPLLLIAADLFLDNSFPIHREFCQALPLKRTFFEHGQSVVQLDHLLKAPPCEREMVERIGQLEMGGRNKPDLFLFVVESLRADYITDEIAPSLHLFKQCNIAPEVSLASGNGTQLSWFSIFYSKFPFYFAQMDPKHWKSGSLGLQCLKELGYEVHVLSSSRLNYYRMDQRVFGNNQELADSFSLFAADENMPAHESDRRVFSALSEKLEEKEGGRCFVIFLESTHFDYSFPEVNHPKFAPYDEGINHVQMAFSKEGLEKVKNRYRNAIHYTDQLFGDFEALMRAKGMWDEAVVIVTGDHGEEFYENGHLFHASNLNWEQIHVPLYFKFGTTAVENVSCVASHVDIFPSLLHYLLKDTTQFEGLFDGESIFSPKKWPYAISGRYNGSRNPYEFLIHDGKQSLLARFSNKGQIFNADALQILDEKVLLGSFDPALDRLTGK